MKLIVAGLILITFSGVALLWRNALDRAEPAPAAVVTPERMTRCMVWKAERGKATVWICGSVHVLRKSDYPLPEPYEQALREAKTVVMELEPDRTNGEARRKEIQDFGLLPEGETLEKRVAPETWSGLAKWCRDHGVDLALMQRQKPWMAAMLIPVKNMQREGFSSFEGLDTHFAGAMGDRKGVGLETVAETLAKIDQLDAGVHETMLLEALDEEDGNRRLNDMVAAWHEGDAARIAFLTEEGLRRVPTIRKVIVEDRNAAWIPKIEAFLDGAETVMVLVGGGHLGGGGGVIELLEKKGVKVTQMEYKTRRPAVLPVTKKD